MGILANPKGIIAAGLVGTAAIAAMGQSPPVLNGAAAYGDWLAGWFAADAARLRQFYRDLGAVGFA